MALFSCLKRTTSNDDLIKESKPKAQPVKTYRRSSVAMKTVRMRNRPYIWFVGPPGLGRRLLCSMVESEFNFAHVDAPALLRAEAAAGAAAGASARAEDLQALLARRRRLPPFVLLDLVKEAMARRVMKSTPDAWLVSGFPFFLYEAFAFEEEVGRVGLILYLTSDVHSMAEQIRQNYKALKRAPPRGLIKKLTAFASMMQPLAQAYDERVQVLQASPDLSSVLQELRGVLGPWSSSKPSNNYPTKATQLQQEKRLRALADGTQLSALTRWRLGLAAGASFPLTGRPLNAPLDSRQQQNVPKLQGRQEFLKMVSANINTMFQTSQGDMEDNQNEDQPKN